MIYELVRRDPAWKVAPMMAACAAAVGAILGPDIAMLSVPLIYSFTFNTAWPHQRAMPFLAALPIATRAIFAARVTAVLSMIWLQLAAGSAAAMLVHGPASPEQAGAALAFGLFFTMVSIWVLTVRVEQCGGWSWLSLPAWCLSLVVPGLVLAGPWMAGIIGLIGLLGGAARFAWTWHKIPAGFQAAPYRAVVEKAESTKTGRTFARRPLLGSVLNWYYLFFAVVGVPVCLLSGVPLHLASFLLPAYSVARRRLRWLPGCGLPLSSRALMAMMVVPLLLVSVAGYAPMAVLLHGADTKRVPEIGSAPLFELNSPITPVVTVPQAPTDTSTLNVTMPFEYWRMAIGRAPEIHAPWGESARPTELRLWPFTLYNPYSVGTQNTPALSGLAIRTRNAGRVSSGHRDAHPGADPRPDPGLLPVLEHAPLRQCDGAPVQETAAGDLRRAAVLGRHCYLPGGGRHLLLASGPPVPHTGDRRPSGRTTRGTTRSPSPAPKPAYV